MTNGPVKKNMYKINMYVSLTSMIMLHNTKLALKKIAHKMLFAKSQIHISQKFHSYRDAT